MGQALNNVGSVSLVIGDFTRAQEVLTRAKEALRSTVGTESTSCVAGGHNLSQLASVHGDFEGMCDWVERAFESVKALFGEEAEGTNDSRFRPAYTLSKGGMYEEGGGLAQAHRGG